MKRAGFILALMVLMAATLATAGDYVNSYTRKDGTYVQGYYRSSPDNSYNNNYSVQGNSNPYTGSAGTNSPTWNDRTPSYNTQTYGNPGTINNNAYKGGYKNY